MEPENWSVRVLVDAKTEYTKQLLDLLTPRIYEGIMSLYEDAKDICNKNKDPNILITFQQLLRSIPKWKMSLLETEYNRIVTKSNCDFLEDLITAIFVANTKILTAIKTDNNRKHKHKLDLIVPNGAAFIHKCYIQVAREFWKNPYLFDDTISSCDIQRNMRDSYNIIDKAITESIRKQLPVRHILKEYLGEIVEDDKNEDDIESILTDTERTNLKKMVEHELRDSDNNSIINNTTNNNEEQLTDAYKNYDLDKISEESHNNSVTDNNVTLNVSKIDDNENNENNENNDDNENNEIKRPFNSIETNESINKVETNNSVNTTDIKEPFNNLETKEPDDNIESQEDIANFEPIESDNKIELMERLEKLETDNKDIVNKTNLFENIDKSELEVYSDSDINIQENENNENNENNLIKNISIDREMVTTDLINDPTNINDISSFHSEPHPSIKQMTAISRSSHKIPKSEIKSVNFQPNSIASKSQNDIQSELSMSNSEDNIVNNNSTIKTVNLELIKQGKPKKQQNKKPISMGYAFYD